MKLHRLFLVFALASPWSIVGPALAQRRIEIDPVPQHLAVVDLDGDRRSEVLMVVGGQIGLVDRPDVNMLEIPGRATLWTVASLAPGRAEQLLILVDGKVLHPVVLKDQELALGPPILDGLDATPPLGIHAAVLARDLDGDQWPELLLPRAGEVRIWHGGPDGFQMGPKIEGMSRLNLDSGDRGGGLLQHYQREIELPVPLVEDINGDGRRDLLVRAGESVRQYVASAKGFPESPTVEVDLSDFRQKFNEKSLDLTNLTKLLKYLVIDEWADLNGDGRQDLLVLSDGKVRIFLGDEQGVSLANNMRPVKLDGNIFYAKVTTIDDDDIPDLVLIGVEDLGLADLAFSLITSFRLRFDFYAFRGKGDGSFHPRMYKQKKVIVEGGRLLKVIDDNQERVSEMRGTVVRVGDLDGDGLRDDLAMVETDGHMGVWLDAVPSDTLIGNASAAFLRRAFSERRDLKVDVSTLTEWVLGRTSALITTARDRIPDWETRLDHWNAPQALHLRDTDGDRRDELIVFSLFQPEAVGDAPQPRPLLRGWVYDADF